MKNFKIFKALFENIFLHCFILSFSDYKKKISMINLIYCLVFPHKYYFTSIDGSASLVKKTLLKQNLYQTELSADLQLIPKLTYLFCKNSNNSEFWNFSN